MKGNPTATTVGLAVLLASFLATGPLSRLSAQPLCPCDCDRSGVVTIAEVIAAVNIALGLAHADGCPAADANGDGQVSVNELVAGVNAALLGCSGLGGATPTRPAATPTATAPPTATPTPSGGDVPPQGGSELLEWLQDGRYLAWPSESAPHTSGGPHFGRVRTYLNPGMLASLEAANAVHPAGVSAVKELYGSAGDDLRGWSVSIKFQSDSAGGAGWHWYERFDGNVFADSAGARGCTGCHSSDFSSFISKDFLLSPFPLQ